MQIAEGKELAAALRAVADFYEANPTLTTPWNLRHALWVTVPQETPAELKEWVRAFGTFNKAADDNSFQLVKNFGRLKIEVSIAREQVCTAKVVGKRKVTKRVPVTFREEESEEDIIEWECPGSILKPTKEIPAAIESSNVALLEEVL